MMLYTDSAYKLYTTPSDKTTPIELHNFDGKCREYIEGHLYIPDGAILVRDDGMQFHGPICIPWKPFSVLDATQREYERQLLSQYKAQNEEYKEALQILNIEV